MAAHSSGGTQPIRMNKGEIMSARKLVPIELLETISVWLSVAANGIEPYYSNGSMSINRIELLRLCEQVKQLAAAPSEPPADQHSAISNGDGTFTLKGATLEPYAAPIASSAPELCDGVWAIVHLFDAHPEIVNWKEWTALSDFVHANSSACNGKESASPTVLVGQSDDVTLSKKQLESAVWDVRVREGDCYITRGYEVKQQALAAIDMHAENARAEERISQFQFCILRVAEALGNVCCGGVDSSPEIQLSDPHSTTRVLCDAIEKRRAVTESLLAENARLRLPPELTLSDHPGCVFCMSAGTSVRPGEVCPQCLDRLPAQAERADALTEWVEIAGIRYRTHRRRHL